MFSGLMRLGPPDGIQWLYTKERPELSHSAVVWMKFSPHSQAFELLVHN